MLSDLDLLGRGKTLTEVGWCCEARTSVLRQMRCETGREEFGTHKRIVVMTFGVNVGRQGDKVVKVQWT